MFVHWDHASQQGLEVSWPLVGGVFALPFLPIGQRRAVPLLGGHFRPGVVGPRGAGAPGASGRDGYAVLTTKTPLWTRDVADRLFGLLGPTLAGRTGHRGWLRRRNAQGGPEGRALFFALRLAPRGLSALHRVGQALCDRRITAPPEAERWERYLEYMRAQITELLTGYGRIDMLWFDGGWERPDWGADVLEATIRRLQPDILINDRLPGVGDFATPNNSSRTRRPGGRWETCLTMNHSWGWCPGDTDYKSARQLVHTLCEVAGKGGNLLLNVSPRGDGSLPEGAGGASRGGRELDGSKRRSDSGNRGGARSAPVLRAEPRGAGTRSTSISSCAL